MSVLMVGSRFCVIKPYGFLKFEYIKFSVTPLFPNYIGIDNATIANIAIPNENMSAL